MRIQDLPKELMFKEIKKHLNNAEASRKQIEKILDLGHPFAMQNREKTTILFALYRIKGRTFVDFNYKNSFEIILNNKESLEADIENLNNLQYVFEYCE